MNNQPMQRRTFLVSLFLFTASTAIACGNQTGQQVTTSDVAASPDASPTAASSPSLTIRVAWLKSPSILSLAKLNGSLEAALKPQGIRVEWAGPFPAFSPAVEALNAGAVDFTIGSSTAAVSAMAGNAPLKIFAYQNSSPQGEGIVAGKDSGIGSVRDLIGKKVAVNRGGTGEYLLVKALEKEGISPDQVERVYLGPSDAGPAFAQGKVDAWAVWGTFLATAETEYQGRVIATGGDIGSQNDIIYVVRTGFLQQHPEVVKAVYDALQQESESAIGNPAAAMTAYGQQFKLSQPVLNVIKQRLEQPLAPVDAAEVDRIGAVADWFYQKGVIPKKPEVSNFTIDITK